MILDLYLLGVYYKINWMNLVIVFKRENNKFKKSRKNINVRVFLYILEVFDKRGNFDWNI